MAQASDAPPGRPPTEPGRPLDRADSPGRRRGGSTALRAAAGLLAAVPLGLLVVAGMLEPNTDGLGTHQQLGLPPCSMRLMLGVRCPSCGMTTSWSHFMRGQWGHSWSANPGGFLLALYSVAFGAVSGVVVLRGRLPSSSLQRAFAVALVAIALVAVVQWLLRLR